MVYRDLHVSLDKALALPRAKVKLRHGVCESRGQETLHPARQDLLATSQDRYVSPSEDSLHHHGLVERN